MATKTSTSGAVVITWTTNEPTASTAMTVADGTAVTSTEVGVFMASQAVLNGKLIADLETLRGKMNAGEGG
jgi:hypothetical protein